MVRRHGGIAGQQPTHAKLAKRLPEVFPHTPPYCDSSHYNAQVLPEPCSHPWPVYFCECIPDGAHDCVFNCANHCVLNYVDYCVYDCVLKFVDYCVGSCTSSYVHDNMAARMIDCIMSRMIPSAR
jgi:hypothetical protein